jgi:uroporphyrinogen decarboxylase
MTNRENALRILRFDNPERITTGMPCRGVTYHGCNHEGYEGGGHDCPVGTVWTDIWGTRWHKEHAGVMGFPKGNPLAESSALRTYQWPDPEDERICGLIYRLAKEFTPGDYFMSCAHRDTLWEKAYMLVGMENMMMVLYAEPEFAREVLHHIMDFQLGIAKHYLSLGVEVAYLGDDLGTQLGPLLNPEIIEEFFVPEYKRLFDLYRVNNVLIEFHSCGKIEAFLDMFMHLGVDVLNPIQATANDLDLVRAKTLGRMSLLGAVSTGMIMAGPPERIVTEVRHRMWQLGRTGGYFCGPDQGMPFPKEHIEAFNRAVEEYGRYPLLEG